jgi:hypothetical protein
MEEWRIVKDYPNYSVSSFGNIRNDKTGGLLKNSVGSYNYLRVCLYNSASKKSKCFRVHRLVGLAFIDNPNNYKELDHINSDKNNNSVSNLQWCSRHVNVVKTPKYTKGKYSSKYRGVWFHAKNGSWCASIINENTKQFIGSFKTEKEAVEARNNYIIENNLSHFRNVYLETEL